MQFSTAFFAMTLALGASALEPTTDGVVYWCYQADGVKFTSVDLCTSRGMQSLEGRSGVSSRITLSIARIKMLKQASISAGLLYLLRGSVHPGALRRQRHRQAARCLPECWWKGRSGHRQRALSAGARRGVLSFDPSRGASGLAACVNMRHRRYNAISNSICNLSGLGMRLAFGLDLGEKWLQTYQ